VPTVTDASEETLILRAGAATEIVAVEERVVSLASVNDRLKEKLPLILGVPEMMPVAGDSETPEGRFPAVILQV
jgi:hypothetical protein